MLRKDASGFFFPISAKRKHSILHKRRYDCLCKNPSSVGNSGVFSQVLSHGHYCVVLQCVCFLFEPEQTGNHFFITWGTNIAEQKRRSQGKCEEWIKEWMKTRTGCWENRGQTSVREFTVGILNAFSDHWLRWTKEWTLVYEKRRGFDSTNHIRYTGLNGSRLKTQCTAACHLKL